MLYNSIHPAIPEKYQNETDYRKIPREYLEQNIPKGRGMIKWSPFASTPELYQSIAQQIDSQSYQEMPILTQEQVEDINYKLKFYSSFPSSCILTYHENKKIHVINCIIHQISVDSKMIEVCYSHDMIIKCINFNQIIDIL